MAKMGRPLKEIDQKLFEDLCSIGCTAEEVEHILNVGLRTIDRWCHRTYNETFGGIHKKFFDATKQSLRRKQIQVALNGNVPMLVFLGKNYLGQKDQPEAEVTNEGAIQVAKALNRAVRAMEAKSGDEVFEGGTDA